MRLDDAGLAAMYAHAEDGYPEEVCGWLSAAGVERCENELHARTAYRFSARDTMRLDASLRSDAPPWVVSHSHVDGSAHLSPEDVRGALADGEPLWPVDRLVVEVRDGRARGCRRYRWSSGSFVQIAARSGLFATVRPGDASHRWTER